MSSDKTSIAPKKKTLAPVVVWTKALDEALDESEREWLTTDEFAADDRFAITGEHPDGTPWRRLRDRSGLQHAVDRNICGLKQSRRSQRRRIKAITGYSRTVAVQTYALWRIYKAFGIEDPRRPRQRPPQEAPPPPQAVSFAAPTATEESPTVVFPAIPRPRTTPDLVFIPAPARSEPEYCDTDALLCSNGSPSSTHRRWRLSSSLH